MADRVVVMNGGIIEQVGSPSEVSKSPLTVSCWARRAFQLPASGA